MLVFGGYMAGYLPLDSATSQTVLFLTSNPRDKMANTRGVEN